MLTLTDILGWGSLDVKFLEGLIDDADDLGIYIDDIMDGVEGWEGDKTNINHVIRETMYLINNTVFDNMLKEVTKERERLYTLIEDNRECEIYTNYLDSHYQNFLDNVSDPSDTKECLRQFLQEVER